MISFQCGQRGKADHSKFPATKFGMRLGAVSHEQSERCGSAFSILVTLRGVVFRLVWCACWRWGHKAINCEGELEGEDPWNPQEMGASDQGVLPRVFSSRAGDDTPYIG